MRKDAKIGFAIGAVLLAVLTVYAIVVPKHSKKTGNTVSLVNPPPVTPAPAADNSAQPLAIMIAKNDDPATPPPAVGSSPTKDPAPAVTPVPAPANNTENNTAIADASNPSPKPSDAINKPNVTAPSDGMIVDAPADVHLKPAKTSRTPQMDLTDGAAAPASSDRVYVVKSGQTLSSIATEVYGNARFWVAIQRENKAINANRLKVGEKIYLPDITPIRPTSVEETAADVELRNKSSRDLTMASTDIIPPAGVVIPPSAEVTPAVSTSAHTYVVKSGDNLYKIARTVLGNGKKAELLYELNRDVIGADKSKLKLGMVLKLPAGGSGGLASSAPVR